MNFFFKKINSIPSFDIPTAVDVLTTGTYSRLPTIIKVDNRYNN